MDGRSEWNEIMGSREFENNMYMYIFNCLLAYIPTP